VQSSEVRQSFLDFFSVRDHEVVLRSSVVPWDDPTLLFTNAGMNQFKDVFLGTGSRPYKRATDVQTVIRAGGKHNDLEDVGKDTYHQTLFEMLGNWSFGDYYKRDAIHWAWQLLTDVWQMPKEKLWATVFREDDEAETLWLECTDISRNQVLRFGEKENFWEMGITGPCGPCSEIHYDYGPDQCAMVGDPDHVCGVNADCGRYMEIWNLVFIQYNRDEKGVLTTLPAKHVDTGMGFERVVAIQQGVSSNYDTDLFTPLISRIGDITGQSYAMDTTAVAMRVLADHIRTLTFAITDGALPSNEGRGYVLRRILRRASRFGRTLGQHEPFLYRLVPAVVELMGEAYPELANSMERVGTIVKAEEESFGRTLDRGLELFGTMVARAGQEKRTEIMGGEAFKLYDTYGFPVDLTQLIAEEQGLTVDLEGFDREMAHQRARSRRSATGADGTKSETPCVPEATGLHSEFLGYESSETIDAEIVVEINGWVVLSKTPFYAESGGQVGDTGWITAEDGARYRIVDTVKQDDMFLHRRDPEDGRPLQPGMTVAAAIDVQRRQSIMRNHTATHLLHAALRNVLGDHVHQTGSLVAPDRLRFDFSHFSAVTKDEMDEIEHFVNRQIWADVKVDWSITALDEAKQMGAMALFGEKYGNEVRVVKIGDASLELCGGTHLNATGETGLFRLLRESSVASGVRRIEALTGEAAYRTIKQDERALKDLAGILNTTEAHEAVHRAEALQSRIRDLEREVKRMSSASKQDWLDHMLSVSQRIGEITVASAQVESPDVDTLRAMADTVRGKLPDAAVGVLFSVINDRPLVITVVTDKAISGHRLAAGRLAKEIAAVIGGGGGGKAHMAQAGGKDASAIPEAMQRVPEIVREHLQ